MILNKLRNEALLSCVKRCITCSKLVEITFMTDLPKVCKRKIADNFNLPKVKKLLNFLAQSQ